MAKNTTVVDDGDVIDVLAGDNGEDQSFDNFSSFADGDDDSLLINLGNVEAMSFEAIPKGRYPAVIEELDYEISKSSKKPMWNVRFSITDGEYVNRKLFMYMSFSDKALPMTKTNIAALGASELLENAFNPKKVAESQMLIGRNVILKVAIEKGQDDEPRNAVKQLFPMGSDESDGFDA